MTVEIVDQPAPIPNARPSIHVLVAEDLHTMSIEPKGPCVSADLLERKKLGFERYGTTLQAFNGRNALVDAYQEALDMLVYLKQFLEEAKESEAVNQPTMLHVQVLYRQMLFHCLDLRRVLSSQ